MESAAPIAIADQARRSSPFPWLAITVLCAFAPCISVYLMAIAAYVYLGHWPYYANPDPKQLPEIFSIPYSAVWISWLFWIPTTVLVGVPALRRINERHLSLWKTIRGVPLLLTILGSVAVFFLFPNFGLTVLVPMAALVQLIGAFVWGRNRVLNAPRRIFPAVLPVVLLVLCFMVMYFDPYGVFEWYMD